jgi:hypothetical protein
MLKENFNHTGTISDWICYAKHQSISFNKMIQIEKFNLEKKEIKKNFDRETTRSLLLGSINGSGLINVSSLI